MPFVLGPALDMKAIPRGKAKHDTSDAHTIAALRRGGLLPQAYIYPPQLRATRDLLRHRPQLRRQRAALLAHGEQPNRRYNLPESGKNIASKAKWDGVAERVADPAVQKSLAVDLALSTDDDQLLPERDLAIVNNAKPHDANTFYRLRSGPGVGKILALGMRYEIHAIHRFPRGQDVVSYGRLVTCAKASAGQRAGTSGKHSGHASLKWAFSEAAVRFRRHNPAGQKFLATLGYRHGKGKALTVLAHKLARAVYGLLKRQTVFDRETFLPR